MTDAPALSAEPARLGGRKRNFRQSLSLARDAIAPSVRSGGAEAIASCGIAFCSPPAGAMVSAYSAMGSELDPGFLVARLSREGFATCLPVIQPKGNPLKFRSWRPGELLVPRTWGILEPADTAAEAEPDILLVPLLAFDRQGFRLGYGGGYYDRTIERLRQLKPIIAIGIAYAEQEVPEVPVGPHDQRLDWVLTPAGPIVPARR